MITVLFALQSPTLLNLLVRSTAWNARVVDLADTAGLAELKWLTVPVLGIGQRVRLEAEFVAVCTPHQWQRAGNVFPRARRV